MKKIILIFLFGILAVFLISCSSNKGKAGELRAWSRQAGLTGKESREELYQKALKEGTLVIYSESTRIMEVKESFEKEYPGLSVFVKDLRSKELLDVLRDNSRTKNYDCDVVICSDNDGQISNELIPEGILYRYIPYDIRKKLYPYCDTKVLVLVGEVQQLFYNSKVYKEAPVKNWWELTQEKYRGRVYLSNPLKSSTMMALLCTMVKEEEKMKEAYYQLYNKELELSEGEKAGEVFIRRLLKNDAVITNYNDEIVEKVGSSDQKNPPLGILISSKARMSDIGYNIAPVNQMEPFAGIYSQKGIMIAGGSKNVNCAKLFIRWAYGEADGRGEGYVPYLTKGTWPARWDVQGKSDITLKDLAPQQLDENYIYKNRQKFEAFWLGLLKERSKKK